MFVVPDYERQIPCVPWFVAARAGKRHAGATQKFLWQV